LNNIVSDYETKIDNLRAEYENELAKLRSEIEKTYLKLNSSMQQIVTGPVKFNQTISGNITNAD